MKITHQIGDRVKVLHNIPLGNLIGTVKAIHSRPKYDVYEVELDGGGTDSLYAEQLERITDTPKTDAVREMWFITPNVELGDGRPIHGNVVDVEFARRLERERNELLDVVNLICGAVTGHAPRELCTTVEAVEWLVDRHKAATAALYKLEEIRTDKLAQAGFSEEPTAISEARQILRHNS